MTATIGLTALLAAFAAGFAQVIMPMALVSQRPDEAMRRARFFATVGFIMVATAFFALMYAHVTDDFSFVNVAQNSHSMKPLIYKISGTWASHEGSMLLWILILSLFGAALAWSAPEMPASLRARALAVQGMTGVGFLAFVILTSNPFITFDRPLRDGQDLNPLLQDPGLALHPPGLYLGYVGFSSVFALAAAILLTPGARPEWTRWMRPWALASWAFLTFGITMGSWWAYYELGWGGWWFWDPVENAALLPWLSGTALLHSIAVASKRGALLRWTLLLAVITFSLSLLGTFLVRSGVLTSVHSFAVDPRRGLFILALLAAATGGALTLYATRAPKLPEGSLFEPLSREGAILVHNLLLCVACATVAVGTLYPLVLDSLGGGAISVGAPYFNSTVAPLLLPALLLMGGAPLMAWGRAQTATTARALLLSAVIAILAAGWGLAAFGFHSAIGLIALAFGAWAVASAVSDARRIVGSKIPHLPRLLAHAGAGLAVIGMAGSAFDQEFSWAMRPGETRQAAGYSLSFDEIREIEGPNYTAHRGTFTLTPPKGSRLTLFPEWRYYPVQAMPLSHVALSPTMARDLYLALGDPQEDGTRAVRFQIHPLSPWIWTGGLMAAWGGLAGLLPPLANRRKKVKHDQDNA